MCNSDAKNQTIQKVLLLHPLSPNLFFPIILLQIRLLRIIPRREVSSHKQRTARPLHRNPHNILANHKRVLQTDVSVVIRVEVVESGEDTRHDAVQPSDEQEWPYGEEDEEGGVCAFVGGVVGVFALGLADGGDYAVEEDYVYD